MKKIKKIAALLLLATVFAFIGPRVCKAGTSKITIDNATVGETYTIYKLFNLESYDTTTGAYSYTTSGTDWDAFFGSSGAGKNYVNIDSQGYVTVNTLTASNVEEFAKLALTYAKNNSVTVIATITATTTTVVFDNLSDGYYLIDTTLGTLCNLDTTKDTDGITIQDKNTAPTVVNKVQEDSTYAKSADAAIGSTLNFTDTITAFKGAQGYVLHVTLDSGLTYNSDVSIAVGGTALALTTDYTVSQADDDTFTITFTDDYLNSITENTSIVVSYTANLNTSAVIGSTGNNSTSTLTYAETGTQETSESVAIVYTWKIDAKKYYLNNSTETGLANAKFKLSTTSNVSNALSFIASSNTYRLALSSESASAVSEITTDSTGEFSFTGLDSGTYYLIETEAPSGYNKLSGPITVVIEETTAADGTLSAKTKVNSTEVSVVKVENKSGTILPSTGGMGTRIFIIAGSLLFITTGIILVTKKRMYNMG